MHRDKSTRRAGVRSPRGLLWLLLGAVLLAAGSARKVVYNTKGGPVPGKLNVHLVPHT